MTLRVPVLKMHHVTAAERTGTVRSRGFFARGGAETLLPFFLSLELISVAVSVPRFVPHHFHEPVRGFAFDLEHHRPLQRAQSLVYEKERNKDRGDANRHKPFIANVARRVKYQAFCR